MMLGDGWYEDTKGCESLPGESAFAASNSSAFIFGNRRYVLGTGGKPGASVHISPLLLREMEVGDASVYRFPW
jgi:hypothetical protein